MNIIYCGFGRAGEECLLQLLAKYPDVNLKVFTHNHPENKGFLELLNKIGISHTTESINKHTDLVKSFQPQILLSVYYRNIIKSDVLKLIEGQSMNLHPSLLPDYRGCMSGPWAIINGEKETGISFHLIEPEIDTGNIILQEKVAICKHDTAFSLYHKLISYFILNFSKAVDLLISGHQGKPQAKLPEARYYSRQLPYQGVMNASQVSVELAKRFIRAMHYPPYGGAQFIFGDKTVEINTMDELPKYESFFLERIAL